MSLLLCSEAYCGLTSRRLPAWAQRRLITDPHDWKPGRGFLVALLAYAAVASACGQSVQHLGLAQPGGMPGHPVITGVAAQTNGVTVTWDGPPGYYQLFQKASPSVPVWEPVGLATNLARRAFVPFAGSSAIFRIAGPASQYAGLQDCSECHQSTYEQVIATPHPQAFESLQRVGQSTNASCLPCHTVGYGTPTGFSSYAATPGLAGVQCENCHGSAGTHAASPIDSVAKPRVELAGEVCGGCHEPTFDTWKGSLHAGVTEDMNATNRIDSCGRCHSGSVRLSLLNGDPLPYGDANVGVVCAVCHDPHQTAPYAHQLLNPLFSTNNYFITTSGGFTNQYNPNINLCAQCHNHGGAAWTSTSWPPHHSPQYNILLGNVGEFASGPASYDPAAHGLFITNQCVGCHSQAVPADNPYHSPVHSHSFLVESYDSCLECHPFPEGLVNLTTGVISSQVQEITALLNQWALTRAPEALRTNYGIRAWEYTNPGTLSPPGPGPASSEQSLIPENLRKARFNLYLVYYDGSLGVHNARFASALLEAARAWVEAELTE